MGAREEFRSAVRSAVTYLADEGTQGWLLNESQFAVVNDLEARARCRNAACAKPLEPRDGQPGRKGALGFCRPCYDRWNRAGRPESGPPPLVPPPSMRELAALRNAQRAGEREERICEFAEWRAVGRSVARAALEVGVCEGTGYRYEAELRRRGEREPVAA